MGRFDCSCGTVALYGPSFFLADHRATDFTLSKICGTATKNSSHLLWYSRFERWLYLLSPAILSLCYSRFEVTWLLRDDSNSKTRVRFAYVLSEFLHGDFLSEIKYLFNLERNILHILTRNVIFFYDYSNWGALSFNIFKFFM